MENGKLYVEPSVVFRAESVEQLLKVYLRTFVNWIHTAIALHVFIYTRTKRFVYGWCRSNNMNGSPVQQHNVSKYNTQIARDSF